MVMCSLYYLSVLLGKLGANGVVISSLVILLSPVLTYCMATGTEYSEEVNKYLKYNNAYIKGTRHDTDTFKLINGELLKESIKQGAIGGLVLVMSMVIVKALELNLSPLYISLLVNSLVGVSFSFKSIVKEKSIKGF
jgi:preprotein translocase subunit SecY